jgi:hypothetical protein
MSEAEFDYEFSATAKAANLRRCRTPTPHPA